MKNLRVSSFPYSVTAVVLLLLLAVSHEPAAGRHGPHPLKPQPARARLVLLIVVDQFRFDYLTRFGDLFGSNGIGRLMRQGSNWTNADYDQMPTYTGPGHASLMTGSWPRKNGIVANDWFERETGKKVSSVTDESTSLLEGKPGTLGYSPRRLLCSTVGDELRQADGDLSLIHI